MAAPSDPTRGGAAETACKRSRQSPEPELPPARRIRFRYRSPSPLPLSRAVVDPPTVSSAFALASNFSPLGPSTSSPHRNTTINATIPHTTSSSGSSMPQNMIRRVHLKLPKKEPGPPFNIVTLSDFELSLPLTGEETVALNDEETDGNISKSDPDALDAYTGLISDTLQQEYEGSYYGDGPFAWNPVHHGPPDGCKEPRGDLF